MLEAAVGAFVMALVGGIGYVLKRRFERSPEAEQLHQISELLDIKKKFDETGENIDSISDLKKEILSRARGGLSYELEFVDQISDLLETQVVMNIHSAQLYTAAKGQLDLICSVLEGMLNNGERQSFILAQEKWEEFAHKQAEFASKIVEGGSMQPMVYSSELRSLSIERAAQIKREIVQRRTM